LKHFCTNSPTLLSGQASAKKPSLSSHECNAGHCGCSAIESAFEPWDTEAEDEDSNPIPDEHGNIYLSEHHRVD